MGTGVPGSGRRRILALALVAVGMALAWTAPTAVAVTCSAITDGSDLQDALSDATCDPILLDPGTYQGPFTSSRSVTVLGVGGPGVTRLVRGPGAGSIITTSGGAEKTLRLQGVTVGGPISGGLGGTTDGPAINAGGTLHLDGVVIADNSSSTSGAGLFWNAAAPSVLRVTDSVIRNNISTGFQAGGVLMNNTGAGRFERVLFDSNQSLGTTVSGGGGGLAQNTGASSTLVNVTFSGNRSNNFGGAVVNGGSMVLNNVTIANNVADDNADNTGGGGGISLEGTSMVAANSIVANNRTRGIADDCSSAFPGGPQRLTRRGYVLIRTPTASCQFGPAGLLPDTGIGYLSGINPQLGPLTLAGVLPLLVGSPAIDAGNPNPPGVALGEESCNAVDQIGTPRGTATTGRCDMGAAEFVPGPAAVPPPLPPAATSARKKCKQGFRLKRIKGKLKCKRKKKK